MRTRRSRLMIGKSMVTVDGKGRPIRRKQLIGFICVRYAEETDNQVGRHKGYNKGRHLAVTITRRFKGYVRFSWASFGLLQWYVRWNWGPPMAYNQIPVSPFKVISSQL
jgi:hypothetical protein